MKKGVCSVFLKITADILFGRVLTQVPLYYLILGDFALIFSETNRPFVEVGHVLEYHWATAREMARHPSGVQVFILITKLWARLQLHWSNVCQSELVITPSPPPPNPPVKLMGLKICASTWIKKKQAVYVVSISAGDKERNTLVIKKTKKQIIVIIIIDLARAKKPSSH